MKKILALILAVVIAASLVGCSFDLTDYLASITYTEAPELPTEAPSTPEPTEEPTPEPTEEPTPEPTEYIEPLPSGVPEDISELARTYVFAARDIMDEAIAHIEANPIEGSPNTHPFVGQNRFNSLLTNELALYERLLVSATTFEEYAFTVRSEESLGRVMDALFIDHPEIEIYFDIENTGTAGSFRTVFFDPEARYFGQTEDMEALKEKTEAFTVVTEYIASRVPSEFSAIDKYRVLAYYLTANTKYAHIENEEIPHYAMNAYGAIMNGWSICQGYALGFEYLCRAANLDCRRLTNGRSDDSLHYWDVVSINEGTYFVDVTWADGSSNSDYTDENWFTWFMFPADNDHVANDGTTTTGAEIDKSGWK